LNYFTPNKPFSVLQHLHCRHPPILYNVFLFSARHGIFINLYFIIYTLHTYSLMTKMSSGRPSPHLRQFAPVKYKKAPQAPRRFKSSYMFFSTTKHKEIRAELTAKGQGQKVRTRTRKQSSQTTGCSKFMYVVICVSLSLFLNTSLSLSLSPSLSHTHILQLLAFIFIYYN
jgi:hypothetical protein